MNCIKCGQELADNALFCSKCGAKQEEINNLDAKQNPETKKSVENGTPQNKHAKRIITISLIIFVIAVALFGAYKVGVLGNILPKSSNRIEEYIDTLAQLREKGLILSTSAFRLSTAYQYLSENNSDMPTDTDYVISRLPEVESYTKYYDEWHNQPKADTLGKEVYDTLRAINIDSEESLAIFKKQMEILFGGSSEIQELGRKMTEYKMDIDPDCFSAGVDLYNAVLELSNLGMINTGNNLRWIANCLTQIENYSNALKALELYYDIPINGERLVNEFGIRIEDISK